MRARAGYILLFAVQLACAFFFLYDILANLFGLRVTPINWQLYEFIEIGAAFGLVIGVIVTARLMVLSARRRDKAESDLRLASGAFMAVLEERFTAWGLTPAERDVALFAIKGVSSSDIATLRNTSEGTVKAQSTAIYRKAGVNSRAQLLSLFIDDLMEGPLPSVPDVGLADRQALNTSSTGT
ncbi:helix-turn-helix transcriptional regulator [uncultured Roseovarius sp.]|uniref:helix-turn-helix transcriptional regulator n=1 Tax=uncultured Roseovarius sp. TaxID=293344 RepID=UPI000C4BA8F2|nr:helix-turn-helix transcriptional regulator [Roseovarius sp.]MBD11784.1 helix-turn-helix transcriptional regulator [Roseovarius sp.]|tara:strand:- start:1866 stop:2414 length:549 start_codon:yes stop_codon:yes gene_type:complete